MSPSSRLVSAEPVSFYITPNANRKEIVGLLRQFSIRLLLGAAISIGT